MPIRVQNDLPVKEILEQENIFVMDEFRAAHQDIRPISIGLFKYTAAGGCDICEGDKPCIQEYIHQSYL